MATSPEPSTPWSSLCTNIGNGMFCYGSSERRNDTYQTGSKAAATTSFADFGDSFLRSSLSNQEKESALSDLHGCPDIPQEDPEMVAKKLAQLDAELRKKTEPMMKQDDCYGSSNKDRNPSVAAYTQAYQQNKEYVQDKKFRLAFLRAETFDVKEATQRLLSFFEQKLELLSRQCPREEEPRNNLDQSHTHISQTIPTIKENKRKKRKLEKVIFILAHNI